MSGVGSLILSAYIYRCLTRDVWLLHNLREKKLKDSISTRDSLFKRDKEDRHLERTITSDEKWIADNNVGRKSSWG